MSSKEIGIEEARKRLGDLITAAQQNGDYVITRNGRPAARIVAYGRQEPPTVPVSAQISRGVDLWGHHHQQAADRYKATEQRLTELLDASNAATASFSEYGDEIQEWSIENDADNTEEQLAEMRRRRALMESYGPLVTAAYAEMWRLWEQIMTAAAENGDPVDV